MDAPTVKPLHQFHVASKINSRSFMLWPQVITAGSLWSSSKVLSSTPSRQLTILYHMLCLPFIQASTSNCPLISDQYHQLSCKALIKKECKHITGRELYESMESEAARVWNRKHHLGNQRPSAYHFLTKLHWARHFPFWASVFSICKMHPPYLTHRIT